MTQMFPNSLTPGYRRSICERDRRVLISSTCEVCGHEIVDSVTDKLMDREEGHRKSCPLEPSDSRD